MEEVEVYPPSRLEVATFIFVLIILSVVFYGLPLMWFLVSVVLAKKKRKWSAFKISILGLLIATILWYLCLFVYFIFFF